MQNLAPKTGAFELKSVNVVVPVDDIQEAERLLPFCEALINEGDGSPRPEEPGITFIGVTPVPVDTSLDRGTAAAQHLRDELDSLAAYQPQVARFARSIVSHNPWADIAASIAETADDQALVLMPWRDDMRYMQGDLGEALQDPPCDIAIINPAVSGPQIKRILLPIRGGPFAGLSVMLAVRLARHFNAEITLLRVVSGNDDALSRVLRERFTGLSDAFPEITTELQVVGDAGATIQRELREHQAVILGASAVPGLSPIGLLTTLILKRTDVTTIVVRTREPFHAPATPELSNQPVIVRVEQWFAENTFHNREYPDAGRLVELKQKLGVKISLGVPTLNDEESIGPLIESLRTALMEEAPLLDEIVVIDGNSSDRTRQIAGELGIRSHVHQHVLAGYGSHRGRGDALWKSLYLLKGDIIIWVDANIKNPDPRLVRGILGPLLTDSRIQYVKGFSTRGGAAAPPPADTNDVSELMARPMINLFFPQLSGIVQPLAATHGGRRQALEQLRFFSGYGAEVGMLLELLEKFGLGSIAQVDLEEIDPRDVERRSPGKMSFTLLQVFARQLRSQGVIGESTPLERTMKLIEIEQEHLHLQEVDVHEQERSPMIEIGEYRGSHLPLLT